MYPIAHPGTKGVRMNDRHTTLAEKGAARDEGRGGIMITEAPTMLSRRVRGRLW